VIPEFIPFPKIARLNRLCVVTEKIDGTNATVYIGEDGEFLTGSRTRWLNPPHDDNFGFGAWAMANKEELLKLGPGTHHGEWWGCGIQRGYGQKGKRFSLFNTLRWRNELDRTDLTIPNDDPRQPPKPRQVPPACVSVVPEIWRGQFDTRAVNEAILSLREEGSAAAPGFMRPEGVVVFHCAARVAFKVTLENDQEPKGKQR